MPFVQHSARTLGSVMLMKTIDSNSFPSLINVTCARSARTGRTLNGVRLPSTTRYYKLIWRGRSKYWICFIHRLPNEAPRRCKFKRFWD